MAIQVRKFAPQWRRNGVRPRSQKIRWTAAVRSGMARRMELKLDGPTRPNALQA